MKIPCGGFYIDENSLKIEDGVLKSIGSGSDLPEVTEDDKNKYLHTNESTGNLEWSAVSGGEEENEIIVIAESQQATLQQGEYGVKAELTVEDYSLSSFRRGDLAELYVDGEKYEMPITLDLSSSPPYAYGYIEVGEDYTAIEIMSDTAVFFDVNYFNFEVGSTHTFAVNVVRPNNSIFYVDIEKDSLGGCTTNITTQKVEEAIRDVIKTITYDFNLREKYNPERHDKFQKALTFFGLVLLKSEVIIKSNK